MLFDMMTDKEITRIPYEKDYRLFVSRMTQSEIDLIEKTLDGLIDETEI